MTANLDALIRNTRRRNLPRLRRVLDVMGLFVPGPMMTMQAMPPTRYCIYNQTLYLSLLERPATHQAVVRLRGEVHRDPEDGPSGTSPWEIDLLVDIMAMEVTAREYRSPGATFTGDYDAEAMLAFELHSLCRQGFYLGRAAVVSMAA